MLSMIRPLHLVTAEPCCRCSLHQLPSHFPAMAGQAASLPHAHLLLHDHISPCPFPTDYSHSAAFID